MKKMRYVLVGLVIIAIIVAIAFCNRQSDKDVEDTVESTSPTVSLPAGFDLAGEWYDRISEKATMIITHGDGDYAYDVEISWDLSDKESVNWTFSGTFDPETGFLYYRDCRKTKITDAVDAISGKETTQYKGGSGSLCYFDEALIWQDDEEDAGADSRFVRDDD